MAARIRGTRAAADCPPCSSLLPPPDPPRPRSYGRNWLKLRAWGLTQYSAILLIDADTLVLRPLAPLFAAPFVFAAGWDQSRVLGRLNTRLKGINGGVLLLRPCEAVQQHMLSLLEEHPKLRFTYAAAEQDFLGW